MALSANSVFEVRTAGNDTNGGGFVTGAAGTDYSQQNAKNSGGNDSSTTDAVANGTGTITSATANFGTTIVGNIIYLQGGTGGLTGGWYQVTARTNATTITVDRNVAAGTGITMNIGGALASMGQAGGVGLVAGNKITPKTGTYPITSASTNVSGGCFSATVRVTVEGYSAVRGDLGTPPVLQASGISSATLFAISGADSNITNLKFDGATLSSIKGFDAGATRGIYRLLWAYQCSNVGLSGTSTAALWLNCRASDCTVTIGMSAAGRVYGCSFDGNATDGFRDSAAGTLVAHCVADSNGDEGFSVTGVGSTLINCSSYGNGRDGIRGNAIGNTAINCISYGNSSVQINLTGNFAVSLNSATVSGGVTNSGTGAVTIGSVVLTADPFTDAPNQNFTLNTTAGGGAACRAAGVPGALPMGGTGYLDIGALQHQDPAGGASMLVHPGMSGGMHG
jgi:hypothetical protein